MTISKNGKVLGQPTKYKDNMPEDLIAVMSKGGSRADFCAKHSISYKTFDLWLAKHKELRDAYDIAIVKSETHWQKIAEDHVTHGKDTNQLNTTAWSMNMRNRFGWTPERKVAVPGFDKAKSFDKKFEVLAKQLAGGGLTSAEFISLSSALATGAKIAEMEQMTRRLEALEQALEQQKQNEAINKS